MIRDPNLQKFELFGGFYDFIKGDFKYKKWIVDHRSLLISVLNKFQEISSLELTVSISSIFFSAGTLSSFHT